MAAASRAAARPATRLQRAEPRPQSARSRQRHSIRVRAALLRPIMGGPRMPNQADDQSDMKSQGGDSGGSDKAWKDDQKDTAQASDGMSRGNASDTTGQTGGTSGYGDTNGGSGGPGGGCHRPARGTDRSRSCKRV